MADVVEIAGLTHDVAQAMHDARRVFQRVDRVLDEPENRRTMHDLRSLCDDLTQSGRRLQSVLGQADALDRMPEYGGPQLLDKVQSVQRITKNVETAMTRAVDDPVQTDLHAVRRTVDESRQAIGESTQRAIDASNDAMRLAKTVQVAGNPTARDAQHPIGSAQQEVRHQQGPSRDSGVQR